MTTTNEVTLIEVGPRDGLQNEPTFVPTEVKVELINKLSDAGFKHIEASSFVSPTRIAQLSDSERVFAEIKRHPNTQYSALVPNTRGLERAISAGAKAIAVFGSASEAFSQKNINCSIDESLSRFEAVISSAKQQSMFVRAYISCVFDCPYKESVSIEQVCTLAEKLMLLGVDEISLGDTIGTAIPKRVISLIQAISQIVPQNKVAMHFHDTYGQALANIYASLEQGISIFDASIAGLGGCPYANGATGNVATEDVLYLLEGQGITTGIDLMQCARAGDYICHKINRLNQSKVAKAIL